MKVDGLRSKYSYRFVSIMEHGSGVTTCWRVIDKQVLKRTREKVVCSQIMKIKSIKFPYNQSMKMYPTRLILSQYFI